MDAIIEAQSKWERSGKRSDRVERDWACDDAMVFFVDARPRAAYFAPRREKRLGHLTRHGARG